MSQVVDWIVSKIKEAVVGVLDEVYPVINQQRFWLLPIPAGYEFVNGLTQWHDDGYQNRRLAIVGLNALIGYGMVKYGGVVGQQALSYYLLGGTAYYAVEKIVVGGHSISNPSPDFDPCGNPITRGGSGGGGAC